MAERLKFYLSITTALTTGVSAAELLGRGVAGTIGYPGSELSSEVWEEAGAACSRSTAAARSSIAFKFAVGVGGDDVVRVAAFIGCCLVVGPRSLFCFW